MLRLTRVLIVALAWTVAVSPAQAQSRFDGWAAAVIAADWRAGDGTPIQAFDNARRDLTTGFLAAGFNRADLVDVSLRPDAPNPTTRQAALAAIGQATARAPRGCLLYFTSHGSPLGMEFGPDARLSPTAMASLVRSLCQDRPTVLIVSACYSGVFLDGLSGPNRMVLTAARRDRSSFGCGQDDEHPYFDACVIESLPTASDFIALAGVTRACVARREAEENLTPPSEPQLSIGAHMQLLLPTLRFSRPSG